MNFTNRLQEAIPLFVLSGMFLYLWLYPGSSFLISAKDAGVIMTVEALVLFFSIFITGMFLAGDTAKGKEFRKYAVIIVYPSALFFAVVYALVAGSWSVLLWFIILILIHQWAVRGATSEEVNRLMLLSFIGIGIFIVTAFLAVNLPVPRFADSYPQIGVRLTFHVEGQQYLAWGCAHFALFGIATLYLHPSRSEPPDQQS